MSRSRGPSSGLGALAQPRSRRTQTCRIMATHDRTWNAGCLLLLIIRVCIDGQGYARGLMRFVLPLMLLAIREEFAVEPLQEAVPADVAEAVRKELAPAASRVLRGGKPFVDFWFRSTLPTGDARGGPGVLYGALKSAGLVGVVRVHGGGSDFKGQKFPAGVYTMRYGVQPEDGDHQGVTE